MTDMTREAQCRRTVTSWDDEGNEIEERCPWRGPLADFKQHTDETGHQPCVVCAYPLSDEETGACARCIQRASTDLQEIEDAYATLPDAVERTGYQGTPLPGGDALVMLADGSMDSPQTPNQYTQPRHVAPTVHVEHPAILGESFTHPAYVEERIPSNGREHVKDHWARDPDSVIAVLEAHERSWRRALGHSPADDLATVTGCVGYLRRWLTVAARTFAKNESDEFGDFAHEIRRLRSRLEHVVGTADDPKRAPAECFDCGGRLERAYRPLLKSVPERLASARQDIAQDDARIRKHITAEIEKHPKPEDRKRPRVPARSTRVRHAVAGAEHEGLSDTLTCVRCRITYDRDEYGLLLRMRVNSTKGWVPVRAAAETLRRPQQTIWRWLRELEIPSVCSVATRRIEVEWEATKALSAAKGVRSQRKAREAS